MTSKSYINKNKRNDNTKIPNKFKICNHCYLINSCISSLLEKFLKYFIILIIIITPIN